MELLNDEAVMDAINAEILRNLWISIGALVFCSVVLVFNVIVAVWMTREHLAYAERDRAEVRREGYAQYLGCPCFICRLSKKLAR